jgi:hypothetical protein
MPRISFDLDDTLICATGADQAESPLVFPLCLLVKDEPLRRGTRRLVSQLRERGWDVCVYTSSLRPPLMVKAWLWLRGVPVSRVITEDDRRSSIPQGIKASKYPPAFGIDLHVDDSEGVEQEGAQLGFKVVVVRPNDPNWATAVLDAVDALAARLVT